ncbi:MAG: hypothetical protein KatS3mg131_3930 [Candidatus Tectimicrobiota bacterium]|nr:MAG: hypothetical protein KatS3mg131_3930 [Candidatus Tectomicrobia bacterium]
MSTGVLVQDAKSNLLESGHRGVGPAREYEFRFPLANDDLGDTAWQRHHTYMLAVLLGPQPAYRGVNEAVWMSDQILVRLGSPATTSIYRPPLPAPRRTPPEAPHRH